MSDAIKCEWYTLKNLQYFWHKWQDHWDSKKCKWYLRLNTYLISWKALKPGCSYPTKDKSPQALECSRLSILDSYLYKKCYLQGARFHTSYMLIMNFVGCATKYRARADWLRCNEPDVLHGNSLLVVLPTVTENRSTWTLKAVGSKQPAESISLLRASAHRTSHSYCPLRTGAVLLLYVPASLAGDQKPSLPGAFISDANSPCPCLIFWNSKLIT